MNENNKPVVIFAYTRAQAIADGVLIDVSGTAREAGFVWPVALTAAVWEQYVRVPAGVECQDENGRLWDILMMLRFGIRGEREETAEVLFKLRVRNNNRKTTLVTLKALLGPGDEGKPCLTVMKPDED